MGTQEGGWISQMESWYNVGEFGSDSIFMGITMLYLTSTRDMFKSEKSILWVLVH